MAHERRFLRAISIAAMPKPSLTLIIRMLFFAMVEAGITAKNDSAVHLLSLVFAKHVLEYQVYPEEWQWAFEACQKRANAPINFPPVHVMMYLITEDVDGSPQLNGPFANEGARRHCYKVGSAPFGRGAMALDIVNGVVDVERYDPDVLAQAA